MITDNELEQLNKTYKDSTIKEICSFVLNKFNHVFFNIFRYDRSTTNNINNSPPSLKHTFSPDFSARVVKTSKILQGLPYIPLYLL